MPRMTEIVLTVSPSLDADGRKACSTRGSLFDGRIGERQIIKRSTTPFCDCARMLAAEGAMPDAMLIMRYAGQGYDAMSAPIGVAAGLTVAEGRGRPRFADWQPYDATQSVARRSPMHQNEESSPK
jgi:hypothetical protein